jgi:hypothetical protein|tara:strand:+ start:1016 stop:1189 length:174 start_codon:yes stop_codon:yes gene_type:complete
MLEQIVQEGMIRLPLAVSDHLRGPQTRQQPGRLQGNAQATAMKTDSGAWYQNPDGSQ